MSQVLKGNKLAFELLYERYFDKLVWYANGYVQHSHIAEDIVQEIFIQLIEFPGKFDHTKRFSTWIYVITGNRCKNYLRDEKQREQHLKLHRNENQFRTNKSHHQFDANVLKQQLTSVFSTLSEKEKMIYQLRFEQELSIKEIAEQLNIPEGSVKSGIYYLLRKYAHLINHFTYEK